MSILLTHVLDNPVLDKDLRLWWRSKAPYALVGIALLLLLGTFGAATEMHHSGDALRRDNDFRLGGVGVLSVLVGLTAALMTLFVPTMASVTMVQERERGTDLHLRASVLTPWQIVSGKFGAALLPALAPWLAFVLLSPTALAHTRLALWQWGACALLLLVHGIALTAIGVAMSCSVRRTRAATAPALFFAVGLGVAGLPMLTVLLDDNLQQFAVRLSLSSLVGISIDAVVAVYALLLAHRALAGAQRSSAMTRQRVVAVVLVVLGVVATLVATLAHKSDVLVGLPLLVVAGLLLFSEAALVDTKRQSAAVVALVLWLVAAASFAPAGGWLAKFDESLRAANAVLPLLWLLDVALLVALLGRIWASAWVRLIVAAVVVAGTLVLVAALDAVTFGGMEAWLLGARGVVSAVGVAVVLVVLSLGARRGQPYAAR